MEFMSTQPVGVDSGTLGELWASRSESPAEPTPQAAPVAEPPSAPEVEPAVAPAESPSQAAQTGTAVEDPDLAFALEKAGISKEDPQALLKLAKLYRETNNRAGEMGRKIQEYEKQPATVAPQAPPPPVQAQPQQAHPAQAQPTVEQYVEQLVQQDREFTALAQDYEALTQEATGIATFDRSGRVSGGRIAELNQQINVLQAQLNGAEQLQKLGLKAPDMDDFQKQELRGHLTILNAEKAQLRFRFQEIQGQQKSLNQSAYELRQGHRQWVESQLSERKQTEQLEREINDDAAKFEVEWKSTFSALTSGKGLSDNLLKGLHSKLKRYAKASDEPIEDLRGWMAAEIEEELKTSDDYHRYRASEYAKTKREDVAVQTQPATAPAVAPPAPGTSGDWTDKLRELHRARISR